MSTEVVRLTDNRLPRLQPAEQTGQNVSAFLSRYREAQQSEQIPQGLTYYQHLLQVIDAMMPEAEQHLVEVRKLSVPAAKVQIANHLAMLLKSFPNAGKDDIEVFGRMLCEDVGAQQPTIGGLEAACRHLRRTCRFIPTISEVLPALADAEAIQRSRIESLTRFPERRRQIATYVEQEADHQREWELEAEKIKARQLQRANEDY